MKPTKHIEEESHNGELNVGDEEDIDDAYDIIDLIISPTNNENNDYEIDIIALADAIQTYGFQEIPDDELTATYDVASQQGLEAAVDYLNSLIHEYWNIINGELIKDLFGQLIDKIIELIVDRLGWTYDFFNKSVNILIS